MATIIEVPELSKKYVVLGSGYGLLYPTFSWNTCMLAASGGSQRGLEEKHHILLLAKYGVSPPNSTPFSPQSGGKCTVLIFSRVE